MTQILWGWSFVVVGTFLVAVGGLLATLGWNKIQDGEQQRNATVSLVQELQLNDALIANSLDLVHRWPRRSDNENFSYSPFHSAHLTAAVTSGRLSRTDTAEQKELCALESYLRQIDSFNAAQRIVGRTNPGLFLQTDLIGVTDENDWPAESEDALAVGFRKLIETHNAAKDLLNSRYPWTDDEFTN